MRRRSRSGGGVAALARARSAGAVRALAVERRRRRDADGAAALRQRAADRPSVALRLHRDVGQVARDSAFTPPLGPGAHAGARPRADQSLFAAAAGLSLRERRRRRCSSRRWRWRSRGAAARRSIAGCSWRRALLLLSYFAYWHDGFYLGPRFMLPLAPWLALWTARLPAVLRGAAASPR